LFVAVASYIPLQISTLRLAGVVAWLLLSLSVEFFKGIKSPSVFYGANDSLMFIN
jgi:hypothetical protein